MRSCPRAEAANGPLQLIRPGVRRFHVAVDCSSRGDVASTIFPPSAPAFRITKVPATGRCEAPSGHTRNRYSAPEAPLRSMKSCMEGDGVGEARDANQADGSALYRRR